ESISGTNTFMFTKRDQKEIMQNHLTKRKKIDDYFPTCQNQQPQDLDEQQLGNFEEKYCFFDKENQSNKATVIKDVDNVFNEKLNQSQNKSKKPVSQALSSSTTATFVAASTIANTGRKKINIAQEIFLELRSWQIYPLIKPFIKLSMLDADGLYDEIAGGINNITASLPDDVKQYLEELLAGDIVNALRKLDQPLADNPSPLLLWTREISRHFILYYHYGGLQVDCNEKTWSAQTIYQLLDLFSVFFSKIVSGKEFGEIDNEAHNDRAYNINYDQKPSNSGCVPKNDAVVYQDKSATILYEQSYNLKEYTLSHYLGDFSKLAHNSVDDLNYHFTQYGNCTTTTAKTFKSMSIHGYKYNVSVYVTDIICIETYRIYEVLSFRIPISYSERWNLFHIAKFGALLEKLLTDRQDVKGKMSKENFLNDNNTHCVDRWIKIPDNTLKTQKKKQNL
ncbi:11719_t:CDS:2, partial [Entrophospora sp. SA101]